jgi:DNA/RNA-binding domain of Phe-tRNA-synthetase-like protein
VLKSSGSPRISQPVMLKAAGVFETSGINIYASQQSVQSRHTEYRSSVRTARSLATIRNTVFLIVATLRAVRTEEPWFDS